MAGNTQGATTYPVNSQGEILAVTGNGSRTLAGHLPLARVPVDSSGFVAINGMAQTSPAADGTALYLTHPSGNTKFPRLIGNSGAPVVLLPSATAITATGAISGFATALPYQPSGATQVYVYAQTGLVAGLYWAIFSSTTACQLYTSSSVTTTLSGITAGAYVGGSTEVALVTVSVPAGYMGVNGALRVHAEFSAPNNANSKIPQFKLAGVGFSGASFDLANQAGAGLARILRNEGSASSNKWFGTSGNSTNEGYGTVNRTTVNTSIATSFTITALTASAADWIILEGYTVETLIA